jgi:hypothetical protein
LIVFESGCFPEFFDSLFALSLAGKRAGASKRASEFSILLHSGIPERLLRKRRTSHRQKQTKASKIFHGNRPSSVVSGQLSVAISRRGTTDN